MNDQMVSKQVGERVLTFVGIAALIAGLAVGGIAFAAVAGVWAGLWTFATGFQLLFNYANAWGDIVAIVCLLDVFTILALARVFKAGNGGRAAAMALVGAIAAFLAFYIPETYRPSVDDNIPPIHDISTDAADPPVYVAVLPLRADAPNTVVYGGSQGMTPDELARLTADAYPDLTTRMLAVPPDQAFERARAAVDALGWELVAAVPADGRIEATDTTFWFRFKDDIVIRIRPTGDGGSAVDARSLSRVGGGDAGTNARRLRAFFAEL
jgi:hypothetical protein